MIPARDPVHGGGLGRVADGWAVGGLFAPLSRGRSLAFAIIFIQNSLRKGVSLADLADITELPLAEVKRLAALPGEHSDK